MLKADAVVIGGGVIGTSIAYRLAQRGRKTILVEKGAIGAATSGSCDKAVFLQSKKPGIHLELAKASRAIYEHLEEELGIPFEFERCGGMIVIETEAQLEHMRMFAQKQQQAGISVRLLDNKEARSLQPALAPTVVGATWCDADAEVNPLLLSYAFATAAERLGARLLTHTEVTGISCTRGKITGVQTTAGPIATEVVVNAAGPFAPAIGRMLGIPIPISPRRGVILITEKVEPLVKGNLLCAQYISSKHVTADPSGQRTANPYGIGLSLGQTKSGNLLIGGSREFVGFDRHLPPDLLAGIASHAVRLVPALGQIRIIRTMTGFRPATGDGLPIIAEAAEAKGLFIAAGHEGDGIALSPVTGAMVADMVDGGKAYEQFFPHLALNRFTASSNSEVTNIV